MASSFRNGASRPWTALDQPGLRDHWNHTATWDPQFGSLCGEGRLLNLETLESTGFHGYVLLGYFRKGLTIYSLWDGVAKGNPSAEATNGTGKRPAPKSNGLITILPWKLPFKMVYPPSHRPSLTMPDPYSTIRPLRSTYAPLKNKMCQPAWVVTARL